MLKWLYTIEINLDLYKFLINIFLSFIFFYIQVYSIVCSMEIK